MYKLLFKTKNITFRLTRRPEINRNSSVENGIDELLRYVIISSDVFDNNFIHELLHFGFVLESFETCYFSENLNLRGMLPDHVENSVSKNMTGCIILC